MTTKRLDPIKTIDNQFFWQAAEEGRLDIQACDRCDRLLHPPRPMCPHCHSTDLVPRTMSGQGTVYSWSVPIHPPAYGFEQPPVVALIDLAEGVRLVSNLIGIAPEAIRNDMPVEVRFEQTPGSAVPVFAPVEESG